MKKYNLIISALLVIASFITSCGGEDISQKTEIENKTVIKKEKPSLTFKIELIKKGEDLADRFGDNSETKVLFKIDGKDIDSDIDIGIGEAFNEGDSATAFISGEIYEKGYFAKLINDTTVSFHKTIMENGDQKEVWEKFYEYNSASGWKLKKCVGDCEGL